MRNRKRAGENSEAETEWDEWEGRANFHNEKVIICGVSVSFSRVSTACQFLARGHCVVPAMHTNLLTKPARPAPSQECQFHLSPLSSLLSDSINTHSLFTHHPASSLPFISPHFLIFLYALCGNNKQSNELNVCVSVCVISKAKEYDFIVPLTCPVFFFIATSIKDASFFLHLTHRHTQSLQLSNMNDLGQCTLTICHLPWAPLRPT